MTGSTTGTILECKGHEPNALVKGALISRKANTIKKVCVKKWERTKCCIKSCSSYVHAVCKDKKFCYNMPNQSTRRNVLIVIKTLPKLVAGYAEVVLVANRKLSSPYIAKFVN
jgi:hypothetical protein